jgi:hypothetical protein
MELYAPLTILEGATVPVEAKYAEEVQRALEGNKKK